MRVRPFVIGAALVVTSFSIAAQADRVETTPVLYKSGDSVTLQVIGATITLPYAPAGWAVSTANETNSSYDILRRQDPTNPQLQVDFNRPNSTCAQAAILFDKLAQIGVKRNSASPLAPMSWEPWSYELPPSSGKSTLKLCTTTPTGTVLANVSYEGSASAIDPSYVRPLLEEVGRALNGKRAGGAVSGGGDEPSMGGSKVTLEVTGLTILLPSSGWHAKVFTGNDGHRVDLVERVEPKDPWLFILIDKKPGKCKLTPKGDSHFVDNPPYLPLGWKKQAVELGTSNGLAGGLMCVNLGDSYAVATVSYMGSLEHPDVIGTRAILQPIAAGNTSGAEETATTTDDVTSGDDDDSPRRKGARGRLEVGGTQVTPAFEGLDKPSGIMFALEVLTNSNKGKTWGLGVDIGLAVGFGGKGFIPWDARIGLGPSILAGPLLVVPLFGVGADAVNGSDEAFRIKAAAYYYYGGQVILGISDSFGIGAGFSLHGRAVKQENVNGVTILGTTRETRFDVRLVFRSFSLGVRYADWATPEASVAKQVTGLVGFPF